MRSFAQTRRRRVRSRVLLGCQSLEKRLLLAASLEPASATPVSGDFETDPRLIGMFHGPRQPGRPIPPIQGIAEITDGLPDSDFPTEGDGANEDPVAAPLFPLGDTLTLHSRPDSNFTIYLDFDGHTTVGTSWNTGYGIDEIVHPNYWGGTGGDFSNSRLELIQQIWQIVAEDFAAFDVNVTTQEPKDLDDLRYSGSSDTRWGTRAVMTKDTFASCSCGGHAYLGSFDDSKDEPALVYNGGRNAGSETVSHEVGHQLGLNHDGVGSTEYYRGHGSGTTGWGPIMGAPFSKLITQWSKGDYFNASRTTQDDLNVITGSANFPYASDDHSDTRTNATPLIESGLTGVQAFGIIEQNVDVDWFKFTTGDGVVSLDIDVLGYKPNLDVWAGLYDADGDFVVDSNPQTELSASFQNLDLAAGTYFLKIDGVARDGSYDAQSDTIVEPSPAPYSVASPGGYSDYGSLGQYRIHGNIVDPGAPSLSISSSAASVNEGGQVGITLTTSDNSSVDVTIAVTGTRQTAPGQPAPDSTEAADFDFALTQTVSVVDGTGSIQISALNDALIENTETFSVQIIDASSYVVGDREVRIDVLESQTAYSIQGTDADSPEGDAPGGGTQTFTLSRQGRSDQLQTVNWQRVVSGDSPADDTDFTSPVSGTIEFGVGDTSKTLNIEIAGDIESEDDETYAIELSVPDGQTFLIDPAQNSAEGRIIDDESVVSLSSAVQLRLRHVKFNSGGFDNWAFDNFRITGTSFSDDFDPSTDSSLWQQISGAAPSSLFPGGSGNALLFNQPSTDRWAITQPVSPPPGAKAEFSIIFADSNGGGLNATENGEDAVLEYSLDGSEWTEIGRFDESEYTSWTNLSVDLPDEATFTPTEFAETDSGTNTQTIVIPRLGYLDKTVTLDWAVSSGVTHPVSAADFVGGFPSGTVTFNSGDATATIDIPVAGDTEVESDETFVLTVSNSSGGPILNASLNGKITNDDFSEPEINLLGKDALTILDNDTTPSFDDGTEFPLTAVDGETQRQLFTIENLGSQILFISGIFIQGVDQGDFSVSRSPDFSIQSGQSTEVEIAFNPTAAGQRRATLMIMSNDSDESDYQFDLLGTATDLEVESVSLNGGNSGRSQIDSILVRFTKVVDHAPLANGFEVRNLNTQQSVRSITATPTDTDGKTEVLLTFDSPNTGTVIFDDGNYELKIAAAAIQTASGDIYPMAADFYFGSDGSQPNAVDGFFRHFGDQDGDRDVDGSDLIEFGQTFRKVSGDEGFNSQLDSDADGDVDSSDYGELRKRFLRTLNSNL